MSADPADVSLSLANQFLERTFVVSKGVFRSVGAVNRRTGANLPLASREFRIVFLDGATVDGTDFVCRGHERRGGPDGTVQVAASLEHPRLGLRAEVLYTLGSQDFYLRKQVSLCADRPGPTPVDRLDVESFDTPVPASVALEYQPIFLGDGFFLGLEYPGCENVADKEGMRVSHYPGAVLGVQPLQSKAAVLGAAFRGDLLKDFNEYVARIRRRCPPFLMWNSGGLLQIYDPVQLPKEAMNLYATLSGAIRRLQEELTRRRQCPFHAFVLEPSWHDRNTLYRVDETKFPGGLGPLARELRDAGSRIGLWLSPTTPVCAALLTRKAVEEAGYAVAVNPKHGAHYPCLSFPRYFTDIKEVMRRYARDLGVGYYKMDFSYFACEGEGHGHLPNLRHGREANLNAMLDLMAILGRENPDLRLVPTSGMWLSPWWLMHAHVIWPHGMMDFDYCRGPVAVNPRDWELTLRDQEFHRLLRQERGRFPLSGMVFMGMAAGPRYNIAGPYETRESYTRTLTHNVARQIRGPERYADIPPSGLAEDWDTTAQTIRWSFDRYHRVPDGEVVLGEPAKGEVYGFRHLGPQGGVIALRNPDMRRQATLLPVEPLDSGQEFAVEAVSPYRRLLALGRRQEWEAAARVALGPYETLVVEIRPCADLRRPIPEGCRYSLVRDLPGDAVFDVFGEPGQETPFGLRWTGHLLSREVDGRSVGLEGRMAAPAKGQTERLAMRRLLDTPAGKQGFEMKTYRLDIPDSNSAVLRILADDVKAHALRISVNMGGFFGGLPYHFCRGEGWAAYDVVLNPRDMNVIRWGFPPDDAPPSARMWLLRRWEMPSTRVRVRYEPARGEATSELPTPFAAVVHSSVCVTDAVPDVTPELRPWTDEYAENAEG